MLQDDKLQEECGIIGIWNKNDFDTAETLYMGMYGIQHRGQQSSGIAVNDDGKMICHKDVGLISEIFDSVVLDHLKNGKSGIGNTGYSKSSDNPRENVQPLVVRYKRGQMAITYNGCLLNADKLRQDFEEKGFILQSSGDAELIAALISVERVSSKSIEEAIVKVIEKIKGSFCFITATPNKLVVVRDPHGMKPLCIGKLKDSYVFASETAALDTMGAEFIRDVIPGEILVVTDEGIKSFSQKSLDKTCMCIFEFVYLARSDSYIDGVNVYTARKEAGKVLARESPVNADLVIGVPDSGLPAAIGFAEELGIPYAEGLIKNRYIGRTFIQQGQKNRENSVRLKLNVIRSQVEGKSIVLVDDSIVRGTTSKKIVQLIKTSGKAKEVHMRISSPEVKYPCYYGIDTPDKDLLIANKMSLKEMCKMLGADSLEFISHEGLLKTPVGAKCNFCSACFNGNYPLG